MDCNVRAATVNELLARTATRCGFGGYKESSVASAVQVFAALAASCDEVGASPYVPFTLWVPKEATLQWPGWRPRRLMHREQASFVETWWAGQSAAAALWHYLARVAATLDGCAPMIGLDWRHGWGPLPADDIRDDHRLPNASLPSTLTAAKLNDHRGFHDPETRLWAPPRVEHPHDPAEETLARVAVVIGARRIADDPNNSNADYDFRVLVDGIAVWISGTVIGEAAQRYGIWSVCRVPLRMAGDVEVAATAAGNLATQPRSNEESVRLLTQRRTTAARQCLYWPKGTEQIPLLLADIAAHPPLAEAFLWLWLAHDPAPLDAARAPGERVIAIGSFDERMVSSFVAATRDRSLQALHAAKELRQATIALYRGGHDEAAMRQFWLTLVVEGQSSSTFAAAEAAAVFCRRCFGLGVDRNGHYPLLAPLPPAPLPSPRTRLAEAAAKNPVQALPGMASALFEAPRCGERPFLADERTSLLANCSYHYGDILHAIMPHARVHAKPTVAPGAGSIMAIEDNNYDCDDVKSVSGSAAAAASRARPRSDSAMPLLFDQMWDAIAASKAFEDGLAPTIVIDAGFPIDVTGVEIAMCLVNPKQRDSQTADGLQFRIELANSIDGTVYQSVGTLDSKITRDLLVTYVEDRATLLTLPMHNLVVAPDARMGPYRHWRLRFLFVEEIGTGAELMSALSGLSRKMPSTISGKTAAQREQMQIAANNPMPCIRRLQFMYAPARPQAVFACPLGLDNKWIFSAANHAAIIDLDVDPRSRVDGAIETTPARSDALGLIGLGAVSSLFSIGGSQYLALGGASEVAQVDQWSLQLMRPIERRATSRHLAGLPPPFNSCIDVAVPLRWRERVMSDVSWACYGHDRLMTPSTDAGASSSAPSASPSCTLLISGSLWMVQRFVDGVTLVAPRSLQYLCGRVMHELDVNDDFTRQTVTDPMAKAFPFNEVSFALPATAVTQRCALNVSSPGDVWYFASDGRYVPWLVPFADDVVKQSDDAYTRVRLLQSLDVASSGSPGVPRSNISALTKRAPPKSWYLAQTYLVARSPLRPLCPAVSITALIAACPIASARRAALEATTSAGGSSLDVAAISGATIISMVPKATVANHAIAHPTSGSHRDEAATAIAIFSESDSDEGSGGEESMNSSSGADAATRSLREGSVPGSRSDGGAPYAGGGGGTGNVSSSHVQPAAVMIAHGTTLAPVMHFGWKPNCTLTIAFKAPVAVEAVTVIAEPGAISWTLSACGAGSTEVELCTFVQRKLTESASIASSLHSTQWILRSGRSSVGGVYSVILWPSRSVACEGFAASTALDEVRWHHLDVDGCTAPIALHRTVPHSAMVCGVSLVYPAKRKPVNSPICRTPTSASDLPMIKDTYVTFRRFALDGQGVERVCRMPDDVSELTTTFVPCIASHVTVASPRDGAVMRIATVPETTMFVAPFAPGARTTRLSEADVVLCVDAESAVRIVVDASVIADAKADALSATLEIINGTEAMNLPLVCCGMVRGSNAITYQTTQIISTGFLATASFRLTAAAAVALDQLRFLRPLLPCIIPSDNANTATSARGHLPMGEPNAESAPMVSVSRTNVRTGITVVIGRPLPLTTIDFTMRVYEGATAIVPSSSWLAGCVVELRAENSLHWAPVTDVSIVTADDEPFSATDSTGRCTVRVAMDARVRTAALSSVAPVADVATTLPTHLRLRFPLLGWDVAECFGVDIDRGAQCVPCDAITASRSLRQTGACHFGGKEAPVDLGKVVMPPNEGAVVVHRPMRGEAYCGVVVGPVTSHAQDEDNPSSLAVKVCLHAAALVFDIQVYEPKTGSFRSLGMVSTLAEASWDEVEAHDTWRLVCVAVEWEDVPHDHPRFAALPPAEVRFSVRFLERGTLASFRPLSLTTRAVRLKSNLALHPPKSSMFAVHTGVASLAPTRLCFLLPTDASVTFLFLLYDYGTNAPSLARLAMKTALVTRRLIDIEIAIQFSDNNVDYTTVAMHTQRSHVGAAWQSTSWASAGPHRFWRLYIPVFREKGVSFADENARARAQFAFAHAVSNVMWYTRASTVTIPGAQLQPDVGSVVRNAKRYGFASQPERIFARAPLPITFGSFDRNRRLTDAPMGGGDKIIITRFLTGRVPPSITRAYSSLEEKCEVATPNLTNPHVWHGDPKDQAATVAFWEAEARGFDLQLTGAEVFPADEKELPVVRIGGMLGTPFMNINEALVLLKHRWLHLGEKLVPVTILILSFRTHNIDPAPLATHFGAALAPLLEPPLRGTETRHQSALLFMTSVDHALPVGSSITVPVAEQGTFTEVAWDMPLHKGTNLVYSDMIEGLIDRLPESGRLRALLHGVIGTMGDAHATMVARISTTSNEMPGTLSFTLPGDEPRTLSCFELDGMSVSIRAIRPMRVARGDDDGEDASRLGVCFTAKAGRVPAFGNVVWKVTAIAIDDDDNLAEPLELAITAECKTPFLAPFLDLGMNAKIDVAQLVTKFRPGTAPQAIAATGVLALGVVSSLPFTIQFDSEMRNGCFTAVAEQIPLSDLLCTVTGHNLTASEIFPSVGQCRLSHARLSCNFVCDGSGQGLSGNPSVCAFSATLWWSALGDTARPVAISGFVGQNGIHLTGTLPRFTIADGDLELEDATLTIAWAGGMTIEPVVVTVAARRCSVGPLPHLEFIEGLMSFAEDTTVHLRWRGGRTTAGTISASGTCGGRFTDSRSSTNFRVDWAAHHDEANVVVESFNGWRLPHEAQRQLATQLAALETSS
jgi:hypothetical protein